MNRGYRDLSKLFAFAFLLAPAGCGGGGEPEPDNGNAVIEAEGGGDRVVLGTEALESLDLEYATAEVMNLTPSLEVPAEIVPIPDRHATIGPRVAGRVSRVDVNVGDEVTPGSPIVTMESVDVGRAAADYISAEADLEVARQSVERARRLRERRISSQQALETAEAAFSAAAANLAAAQARLRAFGVPRGGLSEAAQGRVTLTSPISGSVTARSAHVGQWVEPSEVIIEVVGLDSLWLKASVYERDLRHVEIGQRVQVEVRAYPGEVFECVIRAIESTLSESTRSAQVRVILANPDHRLKPGMFATARILGTHAHEARELLGIPRSAVEQIDGHDAVFVRVDEGVFEVRSVHIGEQASGYVEVLTGLDAGEEVVADGSFLLKGQLLRSTLGEEE
ncbi:MAG: efflux RND transporter periplasmic adaptor subunit [marine benthic group bacterium]|nr:efflux RND transporter periplasmic adaptor subunit [Gemmatimonadota bacterium]